MSIISVAINIRLLIPEMSRAEVTKLLAFVQTYGTMGLTYRYNIMKLSSCGVDREIFYLMQR